MEKRRLDGQGLAILLGISLLLAVNQVVVKLTNQGLQPVFFAGLRSALAVPFVAGWMIWRGKPPRYTPGTLLPGLLIGAVFALEFLCLFVALDLTTISRAVIIFYSMPVWLGLAAHFGLPGERLSPLRGVGLVLAFAGTAWAILDRTGSGGQGSLAGDLFALGGAIGWAATAFLARRPRLAAVGPETQLLWMVAVSAPLLLIISPAFGPLIREIRPEHWLLLVLQAAVVVAGGFITWLWLLSRYSAATVASFSFLTPVLSLLFGWALMGEHLGPSILGSAALVAAGIILVNRRT
ncbi:MULTISPECIES: DMT family transporter [Gemmobacter]|jgi:drug/metabolite transporter (DMT)-like permease|uniref:Drug/metabolite transporter (DMT)-like permease n=1 Tax=Gemmobacter caeni TaxID=589035 RepID=A0A2T6AQE0_9RHOB|nr:MULTISPECIES: DMT family transporter [Gemmobacter]OJY32662.1 MAG: multidrug transporter [Rhodobacterales bacterium 65-51]PTX45966.1 drug/metabolite transporter (DMT)-like permease [Gemmobacter caeni]TWI94268.1 drug/metabolite transporter (DMT)-like permease [Gemmobacter caeni]